MKKEELKDKLECQEFYELMQDYRHAEMQDQELTVKCFKAVKNFILQTIEETEEKICKLNKEYLKCDFYINTNGCLNCRHYVKKTQ